MGKIQELSEQLANQIAAGEVVERPASVVKELVENAIDAGSTQIDILIEEAGLRKIQVIDNGSGIEKADVLTAFKRHATSKIHSREDLFRIRSLGFRGEALPSIASVSEVTIETAVAGESEGTFVQLKGGKICENRPSVLRQGTKITVENLFYNTPARLKYVKTIQTELANVGDIVNRLALSHPQIAFRLVHDGHKMMATAGNGQLKQTIAGIYGLATAKKMLAIQAQDLDFSLTGYVSLPEVTRASRNYLSTIINGRYIKNFALNKAIIEGYGSKLMVGRFPLAVLEITMDPLLVDVNVHPTKQEVRLSKEKELMTLISTAIRQELSQEQLIPNAADGLSFKKKTASKQAVEQLAIPLRAPADTAKTDASLAYDKQTGQFFVSEAETKETTPNATSRQENLPHETLASETAKEKFVQESDATYSTNAEQAMAQPTVVNQTSSSSAEGLCEGSSEIHEINDRADLAGLDATIPPQQLDTEAEHVPARETEENPATAARFPELEYFGQMHGTYLFAQSQEGLYIVDQHAAQERIKYEYFREKIGDVSDDLQALLVPIVLEYPNSDALKIQERQATLAQVGIHLEEFGLNTFVVRAHPTWYPRGEEETVIREMIDMLLTTGQVSVKKFRENTAIMMSCKQSIKANYYLDEAQARKLLVDLRKCENPFNCPHGRPVLIHFTNADMEKMFKRIQDPH